VFFFFRLLLLLFREKDPVPKTGFIAPEIYSEKIPANTAQVTIVCGVYSYDECLHETRIIIIKKNNNNYDYYYYYFR